MTRNSLRGTSCPQPPTPHNKGPILLSLGPLGPTAEGRAVTETMEQGSQPAREAALSRLPSSPPASAHDTAATAPNSADIHFLPPGSGQGARSSSPGELLPGAPLGGRLG